MKPSIGRVVHYVSYGTPGGEYESACRAAVITEVGGPSSGPLAGPTAGLCVLNPEGQFFNRGVTQDQGTDTGEPEGPLCGGRIYHGGTWHWPEREPAEGSPKIHVSADLSAAQMEQITKMIQAAILQQAKRGRTTALKLPGRS